MVTMETNYEYLNELNLPITLQLEITNKCNMHCGFCYNNSSKEMANDLTKEEWLNFSSSVIDSGGVFQCIISGGEPTLFKDTILDLMDMYDSDGSAFTLISNGTGINDTFSKALSKYKWYWVQISIDSHLAETHDRIRGRTGAFDNAISAIKHLKYYNIPVSIASVISDENIYDMEEIIKLAISIGVDQIIFSSVLYSGRASKNIKYYSTENDFILKYQKLEKQYKDVINLQRAATYSEQIKKIRSFPPGSLIVRPNGDVKLDCVLPFVVGNIRFDDIITIWNKAKRIYNEEFFKEYLDKASVNKFCVVANNTNNDIFY